jgi:hypothetical protein
MATVIHPGDHAMTIEFNGRTIATNRVQLMAARHMLKIHVAGMRNKVSPIGFMNRLMGERHTAAYWLKYLDSIL